jgi:hypothetical protein
MTVDPRDEIADAVQRGRMTPSEAEAKLRELGLPPLAPEPDPSDFDLMEDHCWTLPMTIAWIAWRSAEEVTRASDAFRSKVSYWEQTRWTDGTSTYEGFILRPGGPANLLYLQTKESSHQAHGTLPKDAIKITAAERLLWKALSANGIEASGIDTMTGERARIPDGAWDDLEIQIERHRDVLRIRKRRGRAEAGYDDIQLSRVRVLALWPPRRSVEFAAGLPETVIPFGPGYMPLYCAAQWIATRGGTVNFDPEDLIIWEKAYAELLARISSNDVAVTGLSGGRREKLDGFLFASMPINYPFSERLIDLMLGEQLHLVSYVYVDDEHWRKGFDDSLRDRTGTKWSQLMAMKSEIAGYWPFDRERNRPETHSGGAGRPSAMHLVEAEYARRRALGELGGAIGTVATELAAWVKGAYPNLRTPTASTIANVLRERHRKSTK